MHKVLFLYTELAGYTINCMKSALEATKDLTIHVVRWPIATEAPFEFDFGNVVVHERNQFNSKSLIQFIKDKQFTTIICSGWIDKDYKKACRYFKGKIPTVVAFDNQWEGTPKQYIAQFLNPIFIKPYFSHAWVSGGKQAEFAKRLGFKIDKINKGFYVADLKLFNAYNKLTLQQKQKTFPKRFLFVGRYVKHKGIVELWNAFIKLVNEDKSDWELWCVGTGEEYKNRVIHPKIKHFGFLQPKEFEGIIKETGVYILPSHFEPWGVSVQEFAAAGYPLVLSDKIGASEMFLKEATNGFQFESGNQESLYNSLKKVITLDEKELQALQTKSIQLSSSFTIEQWTETLTSFKL